MMHAVVPAIDSAIQKFHATNFLANESVFMQPDLAGYSQVPSLQLVATEHSLAISGSTGSSIAVGKSLGKQLTWAQTNLSDFRRVITDHESTMNRIFRSINPFDGKGASLKEVAHSSGVFQRRPMFEAGNLTFAPVTLSAELGLDAKALLAMFAATNDSVVAEAIAYWNNFAETMFKLSDNLNSISSGLVSSNSGEVFTAADSTMKGLAARATAIATASEVMAGHLEILPAVKAMSVNALSAIQVESKALPNPIAQKAFEQAEVAAFLAGPYTAQLQTAIPRIPNLVSADAGSGVTSEVSTGATVAGRSGTSQFGLSPAGMSGNMQAASAPLGTNSTVPNSPTLHTANSSPSIPSQVHPSASTMPTPTNPAAVPAHTSPASSPLGPAMMSTPPAQAPGMTQPNSASTGALTPSGVGASQRVGGAARQPLPPGAGAYGTNGGGHAGSVGAGNPARFTPFGGISAVPNSGIPMSNPGIVASPKPGINAGFGAGAGPAGSAPTSTTNNSGQRSSGLMNALLNARNGGTGTTSGAAGANHGPGTSAAATAGNRCGLSREDSASSARKLTNVATIRDNDAGAFEQNEYQKELFGEAPITIPAVIGHNVRA